MDVKIIVMAGINFFTYLIMTVIGIACWKFHSTYPDIRIGYHVEFATKNAEIWDAANKYVGKMTVLLGFLNYILSPVVALIFMTKHSLDSDSQFTILFTIFLIEMVASITCLLTLPEIKYKKK